MAGKIEERRKALRDELTRIAALRVTEGGIPAIKARDLAKSAHCALGAIYTVFHDLTEIVLAVNQRTFHRLGAKVQKDLNSKPSETPTEQLIVIAVAYLDFAIDDPLSWRALFDVDFSSGLEVPDWYWDELERLFEHIARPVAACFPGMTEADRALMTRALFSSVHGIVSFGIENRATSTPWEELVRMIDMVIRNLTGNK